MRIKSAGWVVIVLAVTLTIWNVMECQRAPVFTAIPTRWQFQHMKWEPVGTPLSWSEKREMAEARFRTWFRWHTVYVEREVLIIGGAVAAWLIVGRRKTI